MGGGTNSELTMVPCICCWVLRGIGTQWQDGRSQSARFVRALVIFKIALSVCTAAMGWRECRVDCEGEKLYSVQNK